MARDWKTTYVASAAAASHTGTFTATAVAGRGLVAIAAAPATVAVPAGWSEADALAAGELSFASRVADGGETQIVWGRDPASSTAPRTLAGWLESRDDVGSVVGTPATFDSPPAIGGSLNFGNITVPVDGCRIYAAISQLNPGVAWTPVWSGVTGEDIVVAPGHGFESVRMAVASAAAPTAGSYPVSVSGLDPGTQYQAVVLVLGPADDPEEPPPAAETIIEAENRLQGTPKGTWDITGAGSTTIQGYATAMSVARGNPLSVKVHSPSSAWTGKVYRLGYYDGDGAREVDTITGPQTTQPNGTVDGTTLMTSCANWSVNGTWNVPADATPGVYLIKIARNDNTALASHVGPFVVTNSARKAPITVKLSDSTWAAYNHAGADPADILNGRSVYGTGTSSGFVFNQAARAKAVSYDRPFVTRQHLPQTWFFNAEYPLIRWLERLGYDVDVLSCAMVDADPTLLLGRNVVIASGHDEYWSADMHDAFAAAREHATQPSHAVHLSGNEAFWRIRWDGSRRTYACWKDTHDGALNPTGLYSGTWQDTRSFNSDRQPAALLTGQRFRLNGISAYAMAATAAHASSPLWRNTPVAALTGSSTWSSPVGILGFEADEPADTSSTEKPAGLIRLSQVTYSVTDMLSDDDGNLYNLDGSYTHAITAYRSSTTGAAVFAAGTVQYAWGLDEVHDRHPGGTIASPVLQQALTNLLADLGQVPPAYPFPTDLQMPTPVALSAYGLPDPSTDPDPDEEPYCSLASLKHYLGIDEDDTEDDEEIADSLASVHQEIDDVCERTFRRDTTVTTRTFQPVSADVVFLDDFYSLDDLVVTVDGVVWTADEYELWPANGLLRGHPWPYNRLVAVRGNVLPTGWRSVSIATRWGWGDVPAPVREVCKIASADTFGLRTARFGVAGFGANGDIRVRDNPMVMRKLRPYMRNPHKVA